MCHHQEKYTACRNCESGLAMIYKHAAKRLVQHMHMLQVVEVGMCVQLTMEDKVELEVTVTGG